MERFFEKQNTTLLVLFFNNMHIKYTQKQNHFPNIFLNDCTVMDGAGFEDAHKPHMHTYWLKYFVLKYIVKKRRVKVNDILDTFCQIGKYDEHLVRHVIGSLCTANEFRCAELDYRESGLNLASYKIKPTSRGDRLVSCDLEELCFSFVYLEVIIDDQWLAYPNHKIGQSIYEPALKYSHLYEVGKQYYDKSRDIVNKKAKSILHFLKVLEVCIDIEIKTNKSDLYEILRNEGLIPKMDSISKNIIKSTKSILKALGDNNIESNNTLESLYGDLNRDNTLEDLIRKYYKSNILVAP